jgi:hypothetical protein
MILYNIVSLALLVLMWTFFTYEINLKENLIRKLDEENGDITRNYNQLVQDHNEMADFVEKHFEPEQLEELLIEHRLDNYIGMHTKMNKITEQEIRRQIRESLKSDG